MSTGKAVIMQSPGVATLATDIPLPKLRDDFVIVRVKAVALNPTDWKGLEKRCSPGAILGCDYAGIVEEVGKGVTDLKKGDKIAGVMPGSNTLGPEYGSFAEHIAAKAAASAKLPDSLSFGDAATLGAGITTIALGLYQALDLALPTEPIKEKTPIFIYGGSTATGTLAIQFAKLSGYEVITTASPRNHELLRSLGADHVFDYNTPGVGSEIRTLTKDSLKYVLDCIGEANSTQISDEALSSAGGTYCTILGGNIEREGVTKKHVLGYTAMGEDLVLGGVKFEARPQDLECAAKLWKITSDLLSKGLLKTHPAKVVEGGLETIPNSLKDLKDGKASAFKFVHLVD